MHHVACDIPLRIADVSGQEIPTALQLALRHYTVEERQSQINAALRNCVAKRFDAMSPTAMPRRDAILGAWRGDALVAAVQYHVQPGKTAWLSLPRSAAGEPLTTASRLFEAAYHRLSQCGVRLVQVVLDPTAPPSREDSELLRLGGLAQLTDVWYLSSLARAPETASFADEVQIEPYREADASRLDRVIRSTYLGASECLGLETAQDAEDLLASHRVQGTFNPNHWLIVRHRRNDVGCLLLVDHPCDDCMELLYLGLIPERRGQGLGRALLRYAQQTARQMERTWVVTAVDASNRPAMKTYMACGFRRWRERRLFVRSLSGCDGFSPDLAKESPSVPTVFPPSFDDAKRKPDATKK